MERAQVAPIEPEDVTRPKWDIFEKCAHLEAEVERLRQQCGAWAQAVLKLCGREQAREIFDEQGRIYTSRETR